MLHSFWIHLNKFPPHILSIDAWVCIASLRYYLVCHNSTSAKIVWCVWCLVGRGCRSLRAQHRMGLYGMWVAVQRRFEKKYIKSIECLPSTVVSAGRALWMTCLLTFMLMHYVKHLNMVFVVGTLRMSHIRRCDTSAVYICAHNMRYMTLDRLRLRCSRLNLIVEWYSRESHNTSNRRAPHRAKCTTFHTSAQYRRREITL